MLKCSKCLLEKDESEFYKQSSKKRWYRSWCKKCEKEKYNSKEQIKKRIIYNNKRKEQWYYKQERIREYKRKWYRNNKEKICESYKKHYKKISNSLDWKFYLLYYSILRRCNNQKSQNYKWYWWKGIKCERESFNDFKSDMYDSYIKYTNIHWFDWYNCQIDRIDPNKNYCKDNCRWVNAKQNNHYNHKKELWI